MSISFARRTVESSLTSEVIPLSGSALSLSPVCVVYAESLMFPASSITICPASGTSAPTMALNQSTAV